MRGSSRSNEDHLQKHKILRAKAMYKEGIVVLSQMYKLPIPKPIL